MTRILFLPDDRTVMWLESALSPAEIVRAVGSGRWMPPLPYVANPGMLCALRYGNLVLVAPSSLLGDDRSQLPAPGGEPLREALTQRQRELLLGLAEGLTTVQVATRIGISKRQVRRYVGILKRRLGASTLAQLINRAAELGLLGDGEGEGD